MTRAKKPAAEKPAEPESPAETNVLLPLPADLLGAIDDLAASRGHSRRATMRELLERGARAAGSGIELGLEADLAAARRLRWRLDAALAELDLASPEASLICDAMNGTADAFDLAGSGGPGPAALYAEIADAIALNKADAKWKVDGKALLRRMRSLSPVQAAAVVEATRLFWRMSEVDTATALRACGLVRG